MSTADTTSGGAKRSTSRPGARLIVAAVVGVALGVFLLRTLGVFDPGPGLVVVIYLAIGPLGMFGSLELGRFLAREPNDTPARAGAAFGAAAFVLWEMVHAVQLGAPPLWRQHISPELVEILPDGERAVRLIYLGVSTVQATVDVAFDVFFCLSIVAFGAAMVAHPAFGRTIAAFGIGAASGLLLINLWTFPMPPAEAGLWDLGPLTVIWWIAVIVLWQRHERQHEPAERASSQA